ncbi:MAG: SusC/RagA family TonB-linked outer membrane protein [Lutibacter sp.]
MKTKFNVFLTLLLALLVQMSFAQQKTITGTVSDEGGPLPGVNVLIKGTKTGTQTDFDGNYSIKAKAGDILVFSYVGMEKAEKTVGSATKINVQLKSQNILNEVVVTGYRNTTKTKSSIASVTVSNSTINDRPNPSVVQTLSGQVAGLDISTSSGQPGANSTIHLRGINSINGDTEPLFIMDGAPIDQDNFKSLNPNEIESISVLKDAGATAIYGNRGANGVIIIKTKSGNYNSSLKISYNGLTSFSTLQQNDYNYMNSQQQLTLEKQLGAGLGATLTDAEIQTYSTTNWYDFFFRTAQTQSHTLTLSAGGENLTSYVSLGFFDQDGILKSSDLKRFNIRTNTNGKSTNDKFNYGLNLSLNYSTSNEPNSIGSGAINRNYVLGAYESVPYLSPDDFTGNGADYISPLRFSNTPYFLMDRLNTYTRKLDEIRIIGSLNASYKFTDDITAKVVLTADLLDDSLTRAEGPTSFNAVLFAQSGNTTPGFQDQQSTRQFTFNQVTSLNYNKEFGKNTINVGLYTEYFKAHYKTFGFREEGLNPSTFYPGDGSAFVSDNADNDYFVDSANANILNAGLFSYFAQADYDYDSKYGITGTIRRDASYRFAQSNKWGTFYSVAARWNINNEPFMENSAFDLLKLRGSYGVGGNQNISGGGYFSAPDLTRDLFATGTGYGGANSLFLSQIGNSTLEWETVTSSNIGIDFEVFNRRLRGSIDGYLKTTSNLFQSKPVSAINSVNSLNANVGELQNKGVDLVLNYTLLQGNNDGVKLDLRLVGNYNKTEIKKLPGDQTELIGTGRIGGKLFEYYDYQYAGVNPANGNLLYYKADGSLTENPNVDTDRVWLDKNIYPDYTGSFGFNASYKGFFFDTQFNYVLGVDRYDYDLADAQDPTSVGQFRSSTDLLRAWTPTNQVTDIPSLTATNLNFDGTRYLRDASYLRLRFVNFGYNVPSKFLKGTGFTKLKVFANAENLITITKWRGFDAEAQDNTSRIYPTPKIVSFGVEVGF